MATVLDPMAVDAAASTERPAITFRAPSLQDPRLHLASVVITIQVLGQTVFDFDLSIAQILITIGVCASIEAVVNLVRDRLVAWPSSAMLTGNGVALILRVPDTEHGDWWSLHGWWVFAGVAAFSIGSKYVIRWDGGPLFNPSNLGIVVGVIVMQKAPIDGFRDLQVDLQDLWWGPVSAGMVVAWVVIGAGALFITRRLGLMGMALSFWVAFAAGTGLLAATGKCITARWHVGPLCGWELWWVLVTSPEVLIFLAFMITDPKTTPRAAGPRMVFGAGIGALAALLVALFESELWVKVAILASLVVWCAARPLMAAAGARELPLRTASTPTRAAIGVAAIVALAGSLLLASSSASIDELEAIDYTPGEVPILIDEAAVPEVVIDESATDISPPVDEDAARRMAFDLVNGLAVERLAVARGDVELASSVSALGRLDWLTETIAMRPDVRLADLSVTDITILVERLGPQSPPKLIAQSTVIAAGSDAEPFEQRYLIELVGDRYLLLGPDPVALDA